MFHLYHLLGELLSGLLNSLMISLHLLGEILFKHRIFLYLVTPEAQGNLLADLDGSLSVCSVIEPCLRPPVDTTLIRIDTDQSWDIKALYIYVKISKRVDNALFGYCIGFKFFF